MSKPLFQTNQNQHANLIELGQVVDGAIVSKPLLAAANYKQILFVMDTDQAISEHKTPWAAMVHVLDGELDFSVEGQNHQLRANDWLTIAPNAPHDLRATAPTRFLLTLLKDH